MADTPRTFEGVCSTLVLARPVRHAVVLTITGRDTGEHGDAPRHALEEALHRGPFSLFVDARRAQGPSIDASNAWAHWLRAHRDELHQIHLLTSARFVQLSADFVRRFAELGDALFLYTDPTAFDEALRATTSRQPPAPAP